MASWVEAMDLLLARGITRLKDLKEELASETGTETGGSEIKFILKVGFARLYRKYRVKSPIKGEPPRVKYFPVKERRQGKAVWIGPTEKAERALEREDAESFAETHWGKMPSGNFGTAKSAIPQAAGEVFIG